ncbi:MAG: hypothetical protein M3388_16610 [Acidobacteriota bacterium]|nr:hypothetical protein [Acidobacteriota bacterium]
MKPSIPYANENKIKMCGAKTRRGTACRRSPMRNGRCSNHGGKSLLWFAHPNYKHGRYSKYSGIPEREKADRYRKRHFEKRLKAFDKAIGLFVKAKGREPNWKEYFSIFQKTRI